MKKLDNWVGNFFGNEHLKDEGVIVSVGLRKTMVVHFISSVLVFISSLLLVRFSTIPEYGIYIHVFNWISILVMVACFGLEDIVLVEIPLFSKNNNNGAIVGMLGRVNRLFFFIAFAVSVIFIGVVFLRLIPGLNEHRFLFLLSIINIYFGGFIILNQQALQALNKIYASQVADKIVKPFLMILALLTLYLLGKNIDAQLLIICNTIAVVAGAILVFVFLRNNLPKHNNALVREEKSNKNTVVKAGYFLAISLLILLKSRICMLLLGSLDNTADVGVFNIASRLADFVLLPYVLIHAVVPQLFARQSDSDVSYKKNTYTKITQLITFGSGLIMVMLAIFGKIVLSWYDASMVKYFDILLILCISQFLYSLFGPASAILMMQGKQKMAAIALVIDITVSSIVFFFFIDWFGLQGAAWATFSGSLLYNIILRWIVNRHLSATVATSPEKKRE
jgi:O-antigen/teichoic acid export membrane protein